MQKLDVMQLKGLRQILNMDATYGNMQKGLARVNTNEEVFKRMKEAAKDEVAERYEDKVSK